MLYTSCFDANGGLFETLLDEPDAVISDALNHASIIDGIRLSRAQRHRYAHADMADLERALEATRAARTRLIVTDGVFSMDGDVAPLASICALADRYDALVMVDDGHAPGSSASPAAARPSIVGWPAASTSSPPPWARPSAGPAAASRRPGRRSRRSCAALPALSLLEHPAAHARRRVARGPGAPHRVIRASGPARGQYTLVPPRHGRGGLRRPSG